MKRTVLAALLSLVASQSFATVIDFNTLTGSGVLGRGVHYEEDGFQLDSSGTNGFYSIQSGDGRYTGTPSFLNNTDNGVTLLTKIGGGVFSLDSIDLDSLNGPVNTRITFIADLLGGGTTTASFVTDLVFPSLQTFTFGSAFDNVTAVRWTQTAPYHSFDNIVVNAVNNVPEPASAALLCLGLAGWGFASRRRAA